MYFRNLERNLSWLLLVTLTLMLTSQIVARYVFFTSISWVEEFSRIVFIWYIYLSISWIIIQGRHVRVNVLQYVVPEFLLKYFNFLADSLWLLFNVVLGYYGVLFVISEITVYEETAELEIPVAIVHAIIPIGFTIMAFRLIQYMVRVYVKGEPEVVFDTEKLDEED